MLHQFFKYPLTFEHVKDTHPFLSIQHLKLFTTCDWMFL